MKNFIKTFYLLFAFVLSIQLRLSAQVTSFEIDSSKIDWKLAKALDTIYKDDQVDRTKLVLLIKNKGVQTQIDSLKNIVITNDKKNLEKANNIIEKYGWLGPQDVGFYGSQALFLVIQHADLATQKKYYPIIKNAEKEGKILSSNVAILEDRIAMREGQKQIYGSQGFKDKVTGTNYIYPIENPDELDKRRKSMGLNPMIEYNKNWNLEQYKKDLPKIEQIVKEQNIK